MKLLTAVFTYDSNLEYFRQCLIHLGAARQKALNEIKGFEMKLFVIGFGPNGDPQTRELVEMIGEDKAIFESRPGAGFCNNVNYSLELAKREGWKHLFVLNDDAFISMDYIVHAEKIMRREEIAFLGGIPQRGGWNEPMLPNIPAPSLDGGEIENFARLNWEMSAGFINVEKVDVRYDEIFDLAFGLCGDNDFLLRVKRYCGEIWRMGAMRFYHCRGVTQSKFGRDPFDQNDPHRRFAANYFNLKWGYDIMSFSGFVTEDNFFSEPFNGMKFKHIRGNLVEVDGVQIEL